MIPLLVLALALAAPLDFQREPYRRAAGAGALGVVAGRAITEDVRRGAPPQPMTDVGVTVVPRSEAFAAELEQIRNRARREMSAYRTSARAVTEARRGYERALWQAGVAELVRFTAVDPEGRFLLEGLPAGAWLLIAQRAVFVPKQAAAPSKRDRELFERQPRLTGYYAVTFWLQPLTIAPGQTATIELTDRNAWMTGITEERLLDAGPGGRRPDRGR
jgi:hypothetical protein